jgi:GAF domain-containing protein
MPVIADPEQRARQLAEAIVAMGSEDSLDEVLQQTVETAAQLVGARWAALGVLDRAGSRLERFITTGIDDETRARIGDLPGNHGVLRVLLHDGHPLRLADVTQDPSRAPPRKTAWVSWSVVPLTIQRRCGPSSYPRRSQRGLVTVDARPTSGFRAGDGVKRP